ncbi:hypothetical protein CHS0354_024558 [Potamilus streckersoni]|uniref:Centriolar satellite-associated tubulin polyglutamylase complex regulator 1 n=1 Tax=Potamilus streckersoni TaxID=2493646 RepID=A0AAE0WHS3_9BIVA|nr:hypothetical protein CHS0354_024558 [Potamilus streckersoni]
MSMSFSGEDRFSMTAERYLGKHNVLVYLEDSIAQLLEHREENPKLNPIKFLSEYFDSLRDGNHTMFREYAFIKVTPHNRASFIRLFWKCFRQIGRKGDLLSIQEYHSLVTLLCPDFPYSTVQKTARIILLDDALDCLISFSDFIFAFQIQFYFEEFLDKCYEIYQSLLQTAHSPRNPVVVPSGAEETRIHQNSHNPSDGVDAMQYFRAIYPLCDRSTFSTPPADGLKEILFNVPRVSFYGFLMALAKSESINESIGRLPAKAELLDGSDSELTSPIIRMKGGKLRLEHPVNHNGPAVNQTGAQSASPSSAAGGENKHTGKGSLSQRSRRKKESSDESSDESDDDDTSSDTN